MGEWIVKTPEDAIRKRLASYYDADESEVWLKSPQPLLGGAIPNELIAHGREDDLHRVLDQLDDCVYL
jgi:hypothetical protein